MIRSFFKEWRQLIFEENTRTAEHWQAFILLSWWAYMLSRLWTDRPFNEIHVTMEQVMPSAWWKCLLFVVGALQLVGAVKNYLLLRYLTNMFSVFFWIFMGWIFCVAKSRYPGTFIIPVYSIWSFFSAVNIAQQIQFEQLKREATHGRQQWGVYCDRSGISRSVGDRHL